MATAALANNRASISQSMQSNGTANNNNNGGAGGGRAVPQAQIICGVDGVRVAFTVRLGFATCTEALKEECMETLKQKCRDDGIPFAASSLDPHDYDLCPCRPDGSLLPHYGPLSGEREGAPPVRMQMPHLPSPLILSFATGLAWQQRQEMLWREEHVRHAIMNLYNDGLQRIRFVCDLHEEKSLDLQMLRASQETLVAPIEAMMCDLYVAYTNYTLQIRREQEALEGLYARFNTLAVSSAEQLLKQYVTEMNIFFRASCIKVETYVFAGSNVGGQ